MLHGVQDYKKTGFTKAYRTAPTAPEVLQKLVRGREQRFLQAGKPVPPTPVPLLKLPLPPLKEETNG